MRRYRTLVVDPPWPYHVKSRGCAENHYSTLDLGGLARLPVSEWADEHAHLYLWTTNAFMPKAYELVEAWGFVQKTILTWVKPQIGMGHYFRNNTEHCLFAVRGRLPALRKDIPTAFSADRRRHWAKPECFFDIVQAMSPGPYLDVFSRQQRLGWDTWGNECFDLTEASP
jgi:N6-adenosine-specific RNA methylase IME4